MRVVCAVAAVAAAVACASAGSQPAPAEKAGRPAQATPPSPAAASVQPAPLTAAEAAEKAHEAWVRSRGAGSGGDAAGQAAATPAGSDDAPCATSADCTLSRIAPDTCCATLCVPRAVTRTQAAELERRGAECRNCIEPLCRAPPRVDAQCRSGRCVAEPSASPD